MVDIPTDWAQQQYNALAARVRAANAPLTPENLNRAQLMMAQEARGASPDVTEFDMNVERMVDTRPRAARGRQGGAAQRPAQRTNSDAPATQPEQPQAAAEPAAQAAEPMPTPPRPATERGNDSQPRSQATVRRGTINNAAPIDESNPTDGMFRGAAAGGRQADETGIDQVSLGLSILSSLLGPAAAAALVRGGAGAGAAASGPGTALSTNTRLGEGLGPLGVVLRNRMAQPPAQVTGGGSTMPGLGSPPAAPALAGPATPPMLPGSGGAQLALPAPARGAIRPTRPTDPWVMQERINTMSGGPPARTTGRDGLLQRLRERNAPNARN